MVMFDQVLRKIPQEYTTKVDIFALGIVGFCIVRLAKPAFAEPAHNNPNTAVGLCACPSVCLSARPACLSA